MLVKPIKKPVQKFDPENQPLFVAIDGKLYAENPAGHFGWISAQPGGPDSSDNDFDPWPIHGGALEESNDPAEPLRRYSRVPDAKAVDRVIRRAEEILDVLQRLQKRSRRG